MFSIPWSSTITKSNKGFNWWLFGDIGFVLNRSLIGSLLSLWILKNYIDWKLWDIWMVIKGGKKRWFFYNEFESLLIESKVLTKCFDKVFKNWNLLILVGTLTFVYNGYINEFFQLKIHHFSFVLHICKIIKQILGINTLSPSKIVVINTIFLHLFFWVTYGNQILDFLVCFKYILLTFKLINPFLKEKTLKNLNIWSIYVMK